MYRKAPIFVVSFHLYRMQYACANLCVFVVSICSHAFAAGAAATSFAP